MADPYASAWAKIAAEIAAEKRPAPKPETTQTNVVDTLKAELIKARLALAGVTDPDKIAAAAKRLTVTETGALVDPHSIGSGPNFTATLDDVIKDLGETASPNHGQGKGSETANPFDKATYSLTEQMLLWRSDPDRAAHLEYLAAIGRK